MGGKLATEVWRSSRADGAALLVLLAIADYANNEGKAWPQMANLAEKARLSERQVRRHVARLVEMGELEVEYSRGGQRSNRFLVTCGAPREGGGKGVKDVQKGDTSDRGRGADGRSRTTGQGDMQDRPNKEVEQPINSHIEREGWWRRGSGKSDREGERLNGLDRFR